MATQEENIPESAPAQGGGGGVSFAADVQELMRRVQLDPAQVDAVLEQLKEMAKTTYANDIQQITLARLRVLVEAGRSENALVLAKKLLAILLPNNQDQTASLAYRCLGSARRELELEPELHKRLSRALRKTNHFRDAAWNYFRAMELLDTPAEGHDVCLQIASEAEKAEKPLEAMAIYRFVLKQWPDTNMKDFVLSSMEFQELKIRRQKEEQEEAEQLAKAQAAKDDLPTF